MDEVEKRGDNLPTMEELAGGMTGSASNTSQSEQSNDLFAQIQNEEKKEAARESHRNRTGASLQQITTSVAASPGKMSALGRSAGGTNKSMKSNRVSKGTSYMSSNRESTVEFLSNRSSFFDESEKSVMVREEASGLDDS